MGHMDSAPDSLRDLWIRLEEVRHGAIHKLEKDLQRRCLVVVRDRPGAKSRFHVFIFCSALHSTQVPVPLSSYISCAKGLGFDYLALAAQVKSAQRSKRGMTNKRVF